MKKSRQGSKKYKKTDKRLFALILVITFAASMGMSFLLLKDKFAFKSAFMAEIESESTRAEKMKKPGESRRLYQADSDSDEFRSGQFMRKDTLLVAAEDMIKKYMNPRGVSLLDLYMDKDGIVYTDFSGELSRNFRGDAYEELALLEGLYREIRAAVPGFTALKILIEGKEAESIGSHIDISRPIGEDIAEDI